MADLGALETIAGMPLAGTASVAVKAEGTLDKPRARVTLSARDLKSGDDRRRRRFGSPPTWRWRTGRGASTGSGMFDALVLPLDRPGVPKRIDWDIAAQANDSFTALALDRLQVRSDDATITAAGKADLGDPTPKLDGNRAARRGRPLAVPRPRDPAARGPARPRHQGGVARRRDRRDDRRADAGLRRCRAGGRRAARTAGPLAGNRHPAGGRRDRGESRSADGRARDRIGGRQPLQPTSSMPDGTMQVDLPRLAILSQPLATPVEGVANAGPDFSGPLTQPKVNGRADASGLRFGAQRLDKLGVDLALSDATAPAGTLAATFSAGTLDGRANATFARKGPRRRCRCRSCRVRRLARRWTAHSTSCSTRRWWPAR